MKKDLAWKDYSAPGQQQNHRPGPAGAEYTASSGNPEVVAVEPMLAFWVTAAKAEGNAEITVTNEAGPTPEHALPFRNGKACCSMAIGDPTAHNLCK